MCLGNFHVYELPPEDDCWCCWRPSLRCVGNLSVGRLVQHNLSFLSEPDFKHIPELQPHLLVNPLENIGTVGYFLVVWIALIAGRRGVPFYGLLLASVSSVAALCFLSVCADCGAAQRSYLALVLGKFALTAQSSSA